MKDFYQLFIQELKDIYAAEKLSFKLMTEIVQRSKSQKLKETLKHHIEETKKQIHRLEKIAHDLKENFSNSKSDAMQGILKEWKNVVKPHYQDDVQDAAIISFVQRIKHYEIGLYGVLKTFAKHLNLMDVENLLKESIQEEGFTDKKLTEIAEGSLFTSGVNDKACRKIA
jgi:ferritin-like metal-binding protein YciE